MDNIKLTVVKSSKS